ncbi:MAG: T9SS type A sorting domain-containing protein [Candidatus Aegiribacteria sp.]|nr:T9SS type A sorting domain-containing protein [Candidatus Aegiribacteria sp.]
MKQLALFILLVAAFTVTAVEMIVTIPVYASSIQIEETEPYTRVTGIGIRINGKEGTPCLPDGWVIPSEIFVESTDFREDGTIQHVGSCMWQGMSDVFVCDDSVWCSFQDGLWLIDISDISNPEFLSRIYTPLYTLKQGQIMGVNDILIEGDYAYIGDHEGIRIININNMELISTYSLKRAHTLYLRGTNLFVVDGTGFWVLDVQNPAEPDSIGFYEKAGAVGLDIVGDYAYISSTAGMILTILDISNPENPSFVSELEIIGVCPCGNQIIVESGYAYIAGGAGGFHVVDVSDPVNPIFKLSIDFDGSVMRIAKINSQYVVVSVSSSDEIAVIDVSDPDNPFVAASYERSGNLLVDGDRLFEVNSNSIKIQDIQDPLNFVLEGSIDVEAYYSRGIQVSGDFAYIVDIGDWFNSGLNIVDISDPYNPYPRGNYSIGFPSFCFLLTVKDDYAYIPDIMNELLEIVDISNPDLPVYAGEYAASVEDIFAGDPYTYLVVGNTLQITDLQDPSNPSLLSSITLGTEDGKKIYVANEYAFIGDSAGEVWIVDVSDSLYPQMVTSFNAAGEVTGIFAVEDLLYVVSQEQLQIVDISVINAPQIIGSYFDGDLSSYSNIYVDGDYAYIANLIGGFLSIDVSNPYAPFREEFFQTSGWCRGLAYTNDHLYVPTDCSFQILKNELLGINDDDYNSTCIVSEYELSNYPSPAMSSVTIPFSLAATGAARIDVYDITGRIVTTLAAEEMTAGQHSLVWNLRDTNGSVIPSGVYHIRISTADWTGVTNLVVTR